MRYIGILKAVRSVVAIVVIAALTIYVYDYQRRNHRQQATDEAALIREQTRELQAQAAAMNERLRTVGEEARALEDEVSAQRAAVEQRRSQQWIARSLTEGLQIAQALRVAIAETYQTNLRWPASNAQAGMPEPAMFKGQSLRSASIGEGGVVTLTYDATTGVDGGSIRLIPHAADGVTWRCESASYAEIAVLVPHCRFVGSPTTLPPSAHPSGS